MKKLLALLLALLTVASLASCTSQQKNGPEKVTNNDSSSDEITTESDKTENAFEIGDVVSLNDWNITVNSFSFEEKIASSEYTAFTPDEGNLYLVLDITIKNVGNAANKFMPTIALKKAGAKIIYDETYEFSGTTLLGYDKDLHDKQLNPLGEFNGVLAFQVVTEVKDSDKPLAVKIADDGVEMDVKLR